MAEVIENRAGVSGAKNDVLLDKALSFVKGFRDNHGGADPYVTTLQVEFGIGYPRAKRLLLAVRNMLPEPQAAELHSSTAPEGGKMDLGDIGGQDSKTCSPLTDEALYTKALEFCRHYASVFNGRIPSVSSLQVEFGIGYPRAKRMLVAMRQKGDLAYA